MATSNRHDTFKVFADPAERTDENRPAALASKAVASKAVAAKVNHIVRKALQPAAGNLQRAPQPLGKSAGLDDPKRDAVTGGKDPKAAKPAPLVSALNESAMISVARKPPALTAKEAPTTTATSLDVSRDIANNVMATDTDTAIAEIPDAKAADVAPVDLFVDTALVSEPETATDHSPEATDRSPEPTAAAADTNPHKAPPSALPVATRPSLIPKKVRPSKIPTRPVAQPSAIATPPHVDAQPGAVSRSGSSATAPIVAEPQRTVPTPDSIEAKDLRLVPKVRPVFAKPKAKVPTRILPPFKRTTSVQPDPVQPDPVQPGLSRVDPAHFARSGFWIDPVVSPTPSSEELQDNLATPLSRFSAPDAQAPKITAAEPLTRPTKLRKTAVEPKHDDTRTAAAAVARSQSWPTPQDRPSTVPSRHGTDAFPSTPSCVPVGTAAESAGPMPHRTPFTAPAPHLKPMALAAQLANQILASKGKSTVPRKRSFLEHIDKENIDPSTGLNLLQEQVRQWSTGKSKKPKLNLKTIHLDGGSSSKGDGCSYGGSGYDRGVGSSSAFCGAVSNQAPSIRGGRTLIVVDADQVSPVAEAAPSMLFTPTPLADLTEAFTPQFSERREKIVLTEEFLRSLDEDDDEDDDYNNGDNDDEGESEDKAGAGDRSLDQNLGRAQDHDQKPGAAENRTGSAARVCYDLLSDLIAAAVASNKEMSQENAEALSAPIVNSAHNDESIGRPISIRSLIASEPDQVVHESLDGPSSVPSERHSDATAVNEQSDTRQYKNPVTNAMVKGDAVGIADLAAPKNTAGSDCDTETDPNGIQSDAPAATATGERVCASGSVELNHTTNESSEDTVSSQSTRVTPGAAVLRLVDQVWHEPSLEEEPQQLQQSLKRKAPPQ